jgi:hypothetical protein
VASDTEDSEEEDSEEEDSEEEEGTDDDVVVVEAGSGNQGGGRKRKAPSGLSKGTTPSRTHAIVGMAYAKGDPVKLWRAAVMEGWKEAFPGEPMPDMLNIDKPEDVNKITHLVACMVPRTAQYRFKAGALRKQLIEKGGRLFPSRDFLQLRLNYGTCNFLTLSSGLVYVIARAIGVDERDMCARKNVKKWHQRARISFD